MEYDPNIPIWLQVMTAIKKEIVTGRRPPGEKLPGGREMALAYTINPNTAARVYQELERAGLCETRRGLGTFVTEDEIRIDVLRREMAHRGLGTFVTTDEGRITALRADMARQTVNRFLRDMETLGITRKDAANMLLEEENGHA